jgi:hypothetical protein
MNTFNWDLVYFLTEAFGWICSAWFAILLWLRVEGVLTHGWRFVFQPLAINFGASTMLTLFGLGKTVCNLNMRWPVDFDNHELIHRLLLWRNLCECMYKLAQNIGLYVVVCRLPGYVDSAVERGITVPEDGSFALGTNIDEGAPVPISVIMIPLWVAWGLELVIWVVFERVKTVYFVRRGSSLTARFPQPLRGHLLSILRKVVLRPFARTFAYNLHLTLAAKMIAGSYSFSWGMVFIAAWIHYGLLGIFLLYLAVRTARRRLSALSVSHSKSVFYGGFGCARRALNGFSRRFWGRAVPRYLLHHARLHPRDAARQGLPEDTACGVWRSLDPLCLRSQHHLQLPFLLDVSDAAGWRPVGQDLDDHGAADSPLLLQCDARAGPVLCRAARAVRRRIGCCDGRCAVPRGAAGLSWDSPQLLFRIKDSAKHN